MKILALDGSEKACSVALLDEDEVIEKFEIAPRAHAQLLLPMAQSLLSESGYSLSQLDALAFARGPGAFTGLRITASAAQGLALGADLGVVPVSTLMAMAKGARRELAADTVVVSLDARMEEVYIGAYRINEQEHYALILEEQVARPEEVQVMDQSLLRDDHGQVVGVGSGWIYEAELRARLGIVTPIKSEWHCHAKDVAELAKAAALNRDMVKAEDAWPVYLRDSVAQVK